MENSKILGIRINTKGMQTVLLDIKNNKINNIYYEFFTTPIIYNFSEDIAKILKWHKNHIVTTIYSDKIKFIAIKKTERNSFMGRPKDSNIQRMYIEGMVLSLAGQYSLINSSYYKTNLNKIIDSNYEEKCIDLNENQLTELEIDAFSVALAIAIEEDILNDY